VHRKSLDGAAGDIRHPRDEVDGLVFAEALRLEPLAAMINPD
jgi:hypothetical protein